MTINLTKSPAHRRISAAATLSKISLLNDFIWEMTAEGEAGLEAAYEARDPQAYRAALSRLSVAADHLSALSAAQSEMSQASLSRRAEAALTVDQIGAYYDMPADLDPTVNGDDPLVDEPAPAEPATAVTAPGAPYQAGGRWVMLTTNSELKAAAHYTAGRADDTADAGEEASDLISATEDLRRAQRLIVAHPAHSPIRVGLSPLAAEALADYRVFRGSRA